MAAMNRAPEEEKATESDPVLIEVRQRDYCGTCDAPCEFAGDDDYCIEP